MQPYGSIKDSMARPHKNCKICDEKHRNAKRARRMAVRELVLEEDKVYMETIEGKE